MATTTVAQALLPSEQAGGRRREQSALAFHGGRSSYLVGVPVAEARVERAGAVGSLGEEIHDRGEARHLEHLRRELVIKSELRAHFQHPLSMDTKWRMSHDTCGRTV